MIFKLFFCSRLVSASLLSLVLLASTASAVEIVRMDIQIGAVQYDLDLELYDSITPITVTNFLNYVDDGLGSKRYDKSFIHRSVTDFVVQGGGYTFDPFLGGFDYDPVTNTYPGGLQEVPADAAITNEFADSGLSNVRGTISMARTSDPDSATSQWFINQVDNTSLDTGDGYAVFGRVLDDGITTVDLMAAAPILNFSLLHGAFGELPLNNYVSGDPIVQDNLVRINTVTVIQRPVIESDTGLIDFLFIPIGTTVQKTITITNTGNADLDMDGNSLATLSAPFSIVTENCSGNTLSPVSVTPSAACTITVEFSPVTAGSYQDNLVITPSVNPFLVSASFEMIGEGIPTTPVLSVLDNITVLDFIDVALNTISAAETITLQNRGGTPLNLSAVSVSGSDAGHFLIGTGCSDTTMLLTGDTCTLTVNFAPISEGLKSALLTIDSDGGSKVIDFTGNSVGPEIELLIPTLSIDFGIVQVGGSVENGVAIRNTGLADLEITSLVITGADAADFTQINSCPSVNTVTAQPLDKNGVCGIFITFAPTSAGVKNATLTITTTDLDESVVDITLTGATGVADIDAVQQVDMGVAQISITPVYEVITITNIGAALLDFSAVDITGVDNFSYLVGHNCPGTPTTSGNLQPLGQNETCTIEVQFAPDTGGVHNARLEIATNDLDEPVFIIGLTGLGELDVDGITDAEEQNSPNNGDANNDTVQDNIQNTVASFLTDMDVYATIVSFPGSLLYDVSITSNPSPDNMPNNADFKHGIFQYTVVDSSPVVTVGVLMPEGDSSNTYYKYGPTPDNLTPHWYDFSYDGTTGAEYIGQVNYGEIKDLDGSVVIPGVNRSMFILSYIDGQRGDDDLTVNGEIVSVGAVSFDSVPSSGGGGAMSWYLMLLSALMLMFSRSYLSTVEIK